MSVRTELSFLGTSYRLACRACRQAQLMPGRGGLRRHQRLLFVAWGSHSAPKGYAARTQTQVRNQSRESAHRENQGRRLWRERHSESGRQREGSRHILAVCRGTGAVGAGGAGALGPACPSGGRAGGVPHCTPIFAAQLPVLLSSGGRSPRPTWAPEAVSPAVASEAPGRAAGHLSLAPFPPQCHRASFPPWGLPGPGDNTSPPG